MLPFGQRLIRGEIRICFARAWRRTSRPDLGRVSHSPVPADKPHRLDTAKAGVYCFAG